MYAVGRLADLTPLQRVFASELSWNAKLLKT